MKLSSRSRHAISAMMELAAQESNGETPIVDMARKYSLSQSSMEQLFAKLRRSGLVAGRRGRRGGYRLTRRPEQITVAEIIGAVDDEQQARNVHSTYESLGLDANASDVAWDTISQRIYQFLGGITLAEIMETDGAMGQLGTTFTEARDAGEPGPDAYAAVAAGGR